MQTIQAASLFENAAAVSRFIKSTGYTEETLKQLQLTKTPWHDSSVRHLLSSRLGSNISLNLLLRLFFFGEAVSRSEAIDCLSKEVVGQMSAVNLVRLEGDQLIPEVMLVHYRELLLACDSVQRAQAGQLEDLVLGVNRPTQILASCIVPLSGAQNALDLGTGCGTLGLTMAVWSKHVIGTDINQRALYFAGLNAALNGRPNFEVRQGDRFEPVKRERFDLIVCNPPFFLTRGSKIVFTDNPFVLDSFVESLAREAPGLLKEQGYFQMLCEWVEFRGQPWEERVQQWFQNSHCDVLILKDYEISPAEYILLRSAEATSLQGQASEDDMLDHLKYFAEKRVEKIFGGLVTIRRSTEWPNGKPKSRNWFAVDDTGGKPTNPIGDLILERFDNEDVLSSNSDSRLLAAKPRLSRDVNLVQESVQQNQVWKTKITYLERDTDLPRKLGFDAELSEVVAQWDGAQDLEFHASVFARKKNLPKNQVVPNFVRFARRLGSLGLITFSER